MLLLFLFLLLVGSYLILTLAGRSSRAISMRSSARARVGLSLLFFITALGHFVQPTEMSAMLPSFVPYRIELIYLTGVFEVLGAIGVWIPRLMRLVGICLMLMMIGVLPANIYAAVNHVDFGGHGGGWTYLLVRVPFQIFIIWWVYFATEQRWFSKT